VQSGKRLLQGSALESAIEFLSRRKKDPQLTRPAKDCHEQLKQVG